MPIRYDSENNTFRDDFHSTPIDSFENHYVLVFDLTSMQDATENRPYPEVVGEPLRLELSFTYPLEHVTELFALGERMSSVAVDTFGAVVKMYLKVLIYLSSKNSFVSHNSSIRTLVHFPLTMFQFFLLKLLPI